MIIWIRLNRESVTSGSDKVRSAGTANLEELWGEE